ncbi:unnamed protein product [Trypanosoma congolense IL3000]|uniref:WGS project CAEQ00000000 data, annotated contig 1400 n=1 Tax=Trypanosoma congolense (strain IL3000) TaxID=1068625 RepID=F9W5Y2_TRYCI|nr:unnamed protein product [Trypanosoma congolense IL3000]
MLFNNSLVEERYSAWQKKKVRTIIVNSRSRVASHRSIAGALAIAKPYERIELVGGEYFETLLINNPIEIVTADGEESCIISRGSCITITRDIEAYFEQVKFVSKSKSNRSRLFHPQWKGCLFPLLNRFGPYRRGARPFYENGPLRKVKRYGVNPPSGGANLCTDFSPLKTRGRKTKGL